MGVFKSKKMFELLVTSIASFLYCALLAKTSPLVQNILTILFCLYLFAECYLNIKSVSQDSSIIFGKIIFLHLGFILAATTLNPPQGFFWAPDSINTHVPESIKYLEAIKGNKVENLGILPGRVTHLVTGFIMLFLGVSMTATLTSQLFFKLIALVCVYQIGKTLWNKWVSKSALLILGFTPTVLFYNITMYKESAVQAMVALTLFAYLKIFIEKKFFYITLAIVALFLLKQERHYVYYLFLPLPIFFIYNCFFKENLKNYLFLTAFFAAFIFAINKIFGSIYYGFFETALINIKDARIANSNYSDVNNSLNYNIPYALAFIKIIFTPFVSMNKFNIFSNTSLLLIWGSFFNQLVIGFSILGLAKATLNNRIHLAIYAPLLVFFALAAYVAPWSGRLRDSFYPIIALYAAFFICDFLIERRKKKAPTEPSSN